MQDSEIIHSIVIGLGFKARSGKDSAVAAIIKARKNQYDVRRYAFADCLKQEINNQAELHGGMFSLFKDLSMFGVFLEDGRKHFLPEWVEYDPYAPMNDPLCPLGKQRELLQFWGVLRREQYNENYWVDRVAEKIAEDRPDIALLADLRFENEKKWIETYGDSVRVDRAGNVSPNAHISEEALAHVPDNEWGAILKNDCPLSEFQARAVNVFDYLMERPQGEKHA